MGSRCTGDADRIDITSYGAVGLVIRAAEALAAASFVQVLVACGAGAAETTRERANMRVIEKRILTQNLKGRAAEQ
jgi:hypothetical protein